MLAIVKDAMHDEEYIAYTPIWSGERIEFVWAGHLGGHGASDYALKRQPPPQKLGKDNEMKL